jgi:hypothetical protein
MGVLITITNLYDNGVCDQYNIYTGTTYNIDNANVLGTHSLPHTWDGGSYTGPLYVFVEHCDGHIDPPPSENPKKQGGFQVQLLNIDCEQCPPNPTPPPLDCNIGISVVEMFTLDCTMTISVVEQTDCDMTISVVEQTDCDMTISVVEQTDCDMIISVVEFNEPTPSPTLTSTPPSTPSPTATLDCELVGTIEEFFDDPV